MSTIPIPLIFNYTFVSLNYIHFFCSQHFALSVVLTSSGRNYHRNFRVVITYLEFGTNFVLYTLSRNHLNDLQWRSDLSLSLFDTSPMSYCSKSGRCR